MGFQITCERFASAVESHSIDSTAAPRRCRQTACLLEVLRRANWESMIIGGGDGDGFLIFHVRVHPLRIRHCPIRISMKMNMIAKSGRRGDARRAGSGRSIPVGVHTVECEVPVSIWPEERLQPTF
jgi:hypothetical protein